MTDVTQIITDAYRVSNLLAIGTSPTPAQQDEALRYLNRIVKSVFGHEAGERLTAIALGSGKIQKPGEAEYDLVPDRVVPVNHRLMCNLEEPLTVYLPSRPRDGDRFGVVDASKNFSTNPLTVSGNGRQIDGGDDVVLSADGVSVEWFYRDDLGAWSRYTPLTLTGEMPFPEEFDDYFVTMLAVRLNPAYGRTLDEQTGLVMRRAQKQLQSRYASETQVGSELALRRMPMTAAGRDNEAYSRFDIGY